MCKYFLIIVLIFIVKFLPDTVSTAYSSEAWYNRTSRSKNRWLYNQQNNGGQHYNNIYNKHDFEFSKDRSSDESQYIIKNIQTGSVDLPVGGGKAHVSPDHNKTKSYLIKLKSPSSIAKTEYPATVSRRKTHRRKNHDIIRNHEGLKANKLCLKCPPQRTVIAQKYLDGVLIDMPPLSTCRNQQIQRYRYEIVTLFGPTMKFVLPQGDHSFIGRIINKQTGEHEQSCVLKYKVVVRQCGRYYPKNRHLKVKCDMGSIWGSKCVFSCKKGGILSHANPVVCDDDIQWVGEEPSCYVNNYRNMDTQLVQPITAETSIEPASCKLPTPPENGKFSCEIETETENMNNDLNMLSGSICRIKCNMNFGIPTHLQRFSVFHCNNSKWNSTITNVCRYL